MDEKELLEIIEAAARDGRTELRLSSKGIQSLPAEIGQLTNLKELDLSSNELTSVPKELGKLKNLTTLDLFVNRLKSVPKELVQLTNLKELKLGGNGLKSVPAKIGRLTNLNILDLAGNRLTRLTKKMGQLTNLTELDLSHNVLTSVPKELGQLRNLTTLFLDGNRLTSVKKELGQLEKLRELDLSGNQLTSIPEELGQLTNLTRLYLSENQLTSVPKELCQLRNLTMLSLGGNELTSVPKELWQLKSLTELWLHENKIKSVPKEIGQLTNLMELYLFKNQLTSIPAELGNLTNLTKLYLGGNELTSVPKEIGQLTNLRILFLDKNQLTSVPKELVQLKNLKILDLSGNKLTSLPEELVDLGREIKWAPYSGGEEGIFLEGNPLESPPVEIVRQGTEAVLEWFKSIEVEERALNEVKVLLVGNGGAGKTSLVKRLTKNVFNENEPKTHGVNIDEWAIEAEGETIKAHLWDYGGQGIMQATHRVFFSIRSIYILVLNAREEPDPEDWLMNIKSLGGQSPVMIVINKTDVHDYRLNEKYLLEKYPTIKGFYHISCKTGDGLEAFFEGLKEKLSEVEMTKMKWGKDWLAVKERLEGLEEDYISYEEYEDICRQQDVREEGQQKTLIEFLHDLGVVLHFKEFSLEHMKILNPEWITEGIYKIINSKVLKEKKGVLDKKSLSFILNKEEFEGDDYEKGLKRIKYTRQEQVYVIDLMREFELCYEPYGGDGVFVPDLFEEKEPDFDFDYEDCIRFYFEYEYLPGPVMPRFMVRRHGDIEGDLRWRTGVVLKDEKLKSRALVRADKRQRTISM